MCYRDTLKAQTNSEGELEGGTGQFQRGEDDG